MSTQHNQGNYLLSLVIGTTFLIMTFANCFIARAETSSTVIIKESSDSTIKPVARPQKRTPNPKYNVKISPVETIEPMTQKQAPNISKGKHGESVSPSNDKIKIEISPVKKISPVMPENLKTGDRVKSRHQRPLPDGTGTSGNIQVEPISISPIPNAQETQPPLSERIKVTRIRSWKLDQSGNKTNEEIMDSNEVIEGINQPTLDLQ